MMTRMVSLPSYQKSFDARPIEKQHQKLLQKLLRYAWLLSPVFLLRTANTALATSPTVDVLYRR